MTDSFSEHFHSELCANNVKEDIINLSPEFHLKHKGSVSSFNEQHQDCII